MKYKKILIGVVILLIYICVYELDTYFFKEALKIISHFIEDILHIDF